jgi:hypothetical protein
VGHAASWNPLVDACPHGAGHPGGCAACLEERRFVAGPATLAILRRAGEFLADAAGDDALDALWGARFHELAWLSDLLPATCSATYSATMLARFATAFETTARRLARLAGGAPLRRPLRSTVEELAALGILDLCEAMIHDPGEWGVADAPDVLARVAADCRLLRQIAFEAHDVLLLFDPGLDGIEASELAEPLGLDRLGVGAWFAPSPHRG